MVVVVAGAGSHGNSRRDAQDTRSVVLLIPFSLQKEAFERDLQGDTHDCADIRIQSCRKTMCNCSEYRVNNVFILCDASLKSNLKKT